MSIQQDVIREQQLIHIGDITITRHGIKGKKTMRQLTIKDEDQK